MQVCSATDPLDQLSTAVEVEEEVYTYQRAIGILQGLPGTLPNEERLSGIRGALQSAEIEFSPSFVRGDQFSESSGYEAACWLMKNRPEITSSS